MFQSLLVYFSDISKGRELNPIQCYNNIDSDEEPTDYKYIKKNCITLDNIYVKTKIDTTECCNCNDRCRSNDCLCVKLSQQTHYNEEKLPSDFNFEGKSNTKNLTCSKCFFFKILPQFLNATTCVPATPFCVQTDWFKSL